MSSSLPAHKSKWRTGGGSKKNNEGRGDGTGGERLGAFDQRDEEMNIVRQGKTETALLSSSNREEIETSIPTVMLASNDDVRLDDVDEKSILHDILFGRGLGASSSFGAGTAVDADGASSVRIGNERLYFHNDPAQEAEATKSAPSRPSWRIAKPSSASSNRAAPPPSFSAMVSNVGGSSRAEMSSPPPPPPSSVSVAAVSDETSLHAICEDSKTIQEFLERASAALSTREAGSQDGEGRTPLHCVSLNSNLAKATLTREHKLLLERADDTNPNDPKKDGSHPGGATNNNSQGNGKAKPSMGSATKALFPDLHPTYSEDSNNSLLEHDLVDFIITELWRAYRPAMITPDRYGKYPRIGTPETQNDGIHLTLLFLLQDTYPSKRRSRNG
jgi:hypothetical protein